MGSGAVLVLMLLAFMFVWPQEYNDSLLHWYTRQGLTPETTGAANDLHTGDEPNAVPS